MQIYKITNLINGKSYIGQTTYDVNTRWKIHLQEFKKHRRNYPLYNAMDSYGIDNFSVEVIHDNIEDFDELNNLEIFYISQFNTKVPNGYNLTDGGQGMHGYKHTEETKKLLGEITRRNAYRIYTEERSRKISMANKGKVFSKEHREKISQSAKQRIGEKNPFYGKKHSDETKRHWSVQASKRYIQIDKVTGEVLNTFESALDAAEYIQSLHLTTAKTKSIAHGIHMCCEGRYASSSGFIWKSVDKDNKEV